MHLIGPAALSAFAWQVLRLTVWLVLLAAVFVPLERLVAGDRPRDGRGPVATDLCFYFLASLVPAAIVGAPVALLTALGHAIVPSGITGAIDAMPFWARMLAGLLVGEFGFYWGHRWSHEIPLLWRFHAVHHAPARLGWLVNTKVHPVDMVFTRLCGLAPLALLGLAGPTGHDTTLVPVLVVLLGTVWGFVLHAEVGWRFGPLERLVATPAFHHWHHADGDAAAIDRNYASLLPVLDRVFGTLHLPPARMPSRYGIAEPFPSGFLAQLAHPLRARTRPDAPSAGAATSRS